MNQNPILKPLRQGLSYGFLAVGLFLFVFVGAKAIGSSRDRAYVDGKRQRPFVNTDAQRSNPIWVIAPGLQQLNHLSATPETKPQPGSATTTKPSSTQSSKSVPSDFNKLEKIDPRLNSLDETKLVPGGQQSPLR